MTLRDLEREILIEARKVTDNARLKMKDIMEWCTSEIVAQSGEKLYYLPELRVNIAIKE